MTISIMTQIEDAFSRYGDERYGETVTQLEHALQCADLAMSDGAGPDLVLAALLHDIGHLLDRRGDAVEAEARDARHEIFGAQLLRPYFSEAIVAPIALHVAAKRYLCAKEPGYLANLSDASRISLELQGGPFDDEQAKRFIAAPASAAAIRLRRYDDEAKVAGRVTPNLSAYIPLLEAAAEGARRGRG